MRAKTNMKVKKLNIKHINLHKVPLVENSSTHDCIIFYKMKKISWNGQFKQDWIMSANRKDNLMRLHLQFAHCLGNKLMKLIKDAYNSKENEWEMKTIQKEIEDIDKSCVICKNYKRTPLRQVFGMTMAHNFGDMLQVDMGEVKANEAGK